MRHAVRDGLTKATCRRDSEAYAGSVPYEASNMQKGAGAAGAGYAKSWRGLLGVRFAKWWGWWGAGLRQGMGVGSLAHRQSGSGRGGGGGGGEESCGCC